MCSEFLYTIIIVKNFSSKKFGEFYKFAVGSLVEKNFGELTVHLHRECYGTGKIGKKLGELLLSAKLAVFYHQCFYCTVDYVYILLFIMQLLYACVHYNLRYYLLD